MSFYSYKNKGNERSPGLADFEALQCITERVCIQVNKVYDSCLQQEGLTDVSIPLCNLNGTAPYRFISLRNSTSQGGLENVSITRLQDRPNFARVQADVIILGLTPGAAGVVLIVDAAALILLVQTRLRALVGLTVQTDDAVGAEGHIRENEGMQRIGTILQNVVRVPADDDASAFLRQLKNHAALDIPQEIGCGQAVHHAGNALRGESVGKQTTAGGMLAVLFHKFGGEAGFQGDLIDQLLVIEGNAQTLGDLVADGASAGTKFTADGDDFLFHKITS